MKEMKVTIYDVAHEAGLSIATVSRVINGKSGVTPKSERKIREAIEKLGYIPDASAQGLASNLVNTIGIVIAGAVSNGYYLQFLDGAEHAARERGFDVLITSTFGSKEEFVRAIRTRHKMDGLIFPGVVDYVSAVYKSGFPVVYAGHHQPWDKERVHVYGGFSAYRREALNLLIAKGCKRILFIENTFSPFAEKNKRVIEEVLLSTASASDRIEYIDISRTGAEGMDQLLEKRFLSDTPPDGVFVASNPYCAQIYTLAAKYGIAIPDELKVVSVIQSPSDGELMRPPLTALLVHSYQMGYNAAVKLIQIIQGGVVDDTLTYVPYSLLERGST